VIEMFRELVSRFQFTYITMSRFCMLMIIVKQRRWWNKIEDRR